jgi:hypothetical protein
MNEDIRRVVKLVRGPSTSDGIFSKGTTDNGFAFVMVERPWLDDLPDVSAIPPEPGATARYPVRYAFSAKHKRELYHVLDVPGRTVIEWHGANVFEQLLGCGAPGARVAPFVAGSLHPGVPSRDMNGVIASGATLEALHAALKDPATGEQMPFWLDISYE